MYIRFILSRSFHIGIMYADDKLQPRLSYVLLKKIMIILLF